jgi:histidine triad (HIT) family protein
MPKFLTALLCFCVFCFSKTPSCPFCTQDILDNQVFYEDSLVYGLYTHRPVVPAHFLVTPKRHVEKLEKLTQEELLQIHALLNKIHNLSQKVFGTEPYFIHQKNGKEVGQSAPHLHFHYIGKKPGDHSTLKFIFCMIKARFGASLSQKKLQEITSYLKSSLEALDCTQQESSTTFLKLNL